jgi:glycosyltransferase involved in cell wall biosynthesis
MHCCGKCPQIRSSAEHDLSRWAWKRKATNLRDIPIVIVAPTQWIADRVKESSLFGLNRIVRIPLPVDARVFRMLDRRLARQVLGLPLDKKLIFFGATAMTEERKGMRYLLDALRQSRMNPEQVSLVVAGRGKLDISGVPFELAHLGLITDERVLALAYQAADIFVCPSIEDAGPMMIPESMMCGTPVVAFNSGGAPDLIRTMENGYLVVNKDSADLAKGIQEVLFGSHLLAMGLAAHEIAARLHSPSIVAGQYMDLYRSLIGKHSDGKSSL